MANCYTPGSGTFRRLKRDLWGNKVILCEQTVFCFDDESSRYLAARKEGTDVGHFDENARGWEHDVAESKRMLKTSTRFSVLKRRAAYSPSLIGSLVEATKETEASRSKVELQQRKGQEYEKSARQGKCKTYGSGGKRSTERQALLNQLFCARSILGNHEPEKNRISTVANESAQYLNLLVTESTHDAALGKGSMDFKIYVVGLLDILRGASEMVVTCGTSYNILGAVIQSKVIAVFDTNLTLPVWNAASQWVVRGWAFVLAVELSPVQGFGGHV
ncbi:hypothetical protein QBC36DRAFT_311090 [Triangularia setosa]|uniref:Uncharacterized protein n=1 Tax=Triangularia setosa TaxID=2587417 RepID=A0AAN6W6S6_9PEZI|nr:hypothetical protein QBC36DRAFT_311090 [Podospora setosa]